MLTRIPIKDPTKDENKQRSALFRVKCKIMVKLCKVIIDSGSTNNLISEEVLEKLKLTKIPHECP